MPESTHSNRTTVQGSARLVGRRALVTGGATGIGRATVERLVADGADVVVNYIGSAEPADKLVDQLGEHGRTLLAISADVSREDQVMAMFEQAASQLGGPIDLLVNNAGIEKPFRLVDMPLEEWNRVLSVNLTGAFLCARETSALEPARCATRSPAGRWPYRAGHGPSWPGGRQPASRSRAGRAARGLLAARQPGVIVNVSSVHELIPWPRFSHYCASKGAIKLFAQTIARELAGDGIRVVNVAPGAILTPINQDLIEHPDKRAEVESEIPLGRMGTPDDIAAAISWLASSEAGYVTGSTLLVDGGMTLFPRFV